ncbi:hypothetical protein [Blastococcus sp. PRF04-17]|uniref:hypothetical protein n=1 Tax=Blastococcus sp. PRF04-17 TaxID=2933797 RepID=UPI001FF110B5|nr:hypothetical protein [Blastococcus sp. PRF04-17]UOY03824.1 hypothetical protein MVA48_11070 [Blastococcus sp. PRF04-17]
MTPLQLLDRLGWAVVAVVVGGWLVLVQVFWLPLRIGGVLVPVSVLAAVVGNLLLPALLHRLSGSRLVAVLPVVVWLVVAVSSMSRRPEGDVVLLGTGALGTLSLVFLMTGVLAAAVSVGRILGSAARPRVRPADPAGSGSGGAR